MNLIRIWQCGECGNIFYDYPEDFVCCGDLDLELSFLDKDNNKLYSSKAVESYLCGMCKGVGYIYGGFDINGCEIYEKCICCKTTGLKNSSEKNTGVKQ